MTASLSDGLRDVERELADERARHAADVEALRVALAAAEARATALDARLGRVEEERRRLEADLAEVRATTWWRLHERFLPVLRPLRRIRRR
jgi:hypothetical protein